MTGARRSPARGAPVLGLGAAGVVRARGGDGRGARGCDHLRDRPEPVPRTGPIHPRSGRARPWCGAEREHRARCSIPIFALRCRLRLEPGRSASAAFTTLVSTTAERAFELADRYHDPRSAQRALDLAWTAAQVELRELNITPADAGVFQELAGALFFSDPRLRAPEAELLAQSGLAAHALGARPLGRLADPARHHRLGGGPADAAAAPLPRTSTGAGAG